MKKLSSFNRGFLGGFTALVLGAALLAAGAVAAQELLDPEDASSSEGQSGEEALLAEQGVFAPAAADSAAGVLHVFQTIATFNGAGPAAYGRSGMHAACRAEDPASHFCTIQEVENAWKTGGLDILAVNQSWIDNAIVGTVNSNYGGDVSAASDWYGGAANGDYPYNCNGWTSSNNLARGMILNDGAISPATEACDDTHPIACCR